MLHAPGPAVTGIARVNHVPALVGTARTGAGVGVAIRPGRVGEALIAGPEAGRLRIVLQALLGALQPALAGSVIPAVGQARVPEAAEPTRPAVGRSAAAAAAALLTSGDTADE